MLSGVCKVITVPVSGQVYLLEIDLLLVVVLLEDVLRSRGGVNGDSGDDDDMI